MKHYFSDKVKEVFDKVNIVQNLARKKFMFSFLMGLIKSRQVHFCEIAEYLNEEAQSLSNEVRIQDFPETKSSGQISVRSSWTMSK